MQQRLYERPSKGIRLAVYEYDIVIDRAQQIEDPVQSTRHKP